MGYDPGFIGLGRIGMVEKMVGEVEGSPTRGDLESRWPTGVGMRVPQSIPSRSFVNLLLLTF